MLIGLNRERMGKSAGIRTHMMVGMGACLFTSLSLHGFLDADPSRVASSVVTGIGFLGAGVIVKRHGDIHDLTTAASIWMAAAIGMAVGVGALLLASGATVLAWVTLEILRHITKDHDGDSVVAENNSG
ncbi:MAG: MgtC/SapB family protein [Anaerolineae bacterium]|nr:MgtC/SapB family protein [Anaerolineae bacterium]